MIDTEEADGSKRVGLDGDGDLDIISAEGRSGVNWFENDENGSFSTERDVMSNAFSNSIEGVNAYDFDEDGKQSVFAVSNGGGKIEMTESTTSDARFWRENVALKKLVFSTQKTLISDIDRDGDMDIAYAWEGGSMKSGGYGWLEYTGGDLLDTRNWKNHGIAQIEGAWWLTSPIDIDDDRDEDFVGTVHENLNPAANGRLVLLKKPTDPPATWSVHTIDDTTGLVPNNAELADFDGDGATDIAAATYDNGTGIYWYDTDDGFGRTAITTTRTWYGLGAGDFTGNGRAELVVVERDVTLTNGDRDTIISYEYIDGEWRVRRSKLFGKSDDQVSVVDIDGAGDYDVLTGSQAAGTVWWEVTNLDNGLKRPNSRSSQSTNLSDVL